MNQEIVTKKCSKCGEVKNITEFYIDKTKLSSVYGSCKSCEKTKAILRKQYLILQRQQNPVNIENKICSKCQKAKDISQFSRKINNVDGYSYYCKQCQQNDNIKLKNKFRINNQFSLIASKTCTICKKEKEIMQFSKNSYSKDGYYDWCKSCVSIHDEASSNIKNINRQHVLEKLCTKCKMIKLIGMFPKNRRNIDGYHNWCKTCQYDRRKERLKIDIDFKLKVVLRSNMDRALKGNFKHGKAIELLGCSIVEWKAHLFNLFTVGMSWNNYGNKEGQWSIDHKIPCSSFNLHDPIQHSSDLV